MVPIIVAFVVILLIILVGYYVMQPGEPEKPNPVTVTPVIASDGKPAVIVQPADMSATRVEVVPVVAAPTPAPASTTTSATAEPKLIGCLADSSDLILPKLVPGGQLTWEQCRAAAGKSKYFGLEYWNGDKNRKTGNCLHGDVLKRQLPATNCIIEDGRTIGSNWSIGVYENPA